MGDILNFNSVFFSHWLHHWWLMKHPFLFSISRQQAVLPNVPTSFYANTVIDHYKENKVTVIVCPILYIHFWCHNFLSLLKKIKEKKCLFVLQSKMKEELMLKPIVKWFIIYSGHSSIAKCLWMNVVIKYLIFFNLFYISPIINEATHWIYNSEL